MKIYYLWQNENTGYDTYDSMVVQANSRSEAKDLSIEKAYSERCWCRKNDIQIRAIGETPEYVAKSQVICASFNAG